MPSPSLPPQTSLPPEHEQLLAALLDEYVSRLERGEKPSVEELVAAHPEFADELREYLDGVRLIHHALHEPAPSPAKEHLAAPRESTPRVLGDYELRREIGRGGMGVVYEAHQLSLNRSVALKVLPFAAVLDQRQIARFRNEAQAAAQLHHPHIVPVYAVGQERGIHFYAMQLIEGQSLDQVIAELRQNSSPQREATRPDATTVAIHPPAAASTVPGPGLQSPVRERPFFQSTAELGRQAASALAHAHELGIVHRDIKPSNLLIDQQGKLWITDFGLARMQSELGVTYTGDIVGTLRYMSPEQARGRADRVDGRSDVYSLGVTLYELLTLEPLFADEHHASLLAKIENTEPRRPRELNPAIPIDLENVVLRAIEKDRDRRYASAEEFARDLACFLEGRPTVARPPTLRDRVGRWVRRRQRLVLAAGGVLALLAAGAVVSSVLIAQAHRLTAAALTEKDQHLREALRVVDHFGGELADRMAEVPGAELLRMELLSDTQDYYQHFLATSGAAVRDELAGAHFRSAEIAAKLGDLPRAEAHYAAALAAWREELAKKPKSAALRAHVGLGEHQWGHALAPLHARKAGQHYAAALDLRRQLVQEFPTDSTRLAELAETEVNLGLLEFAAGKSTGIALVQQAAQHSENALRQQPQSDPLARRLAVARNNLSFVLRDADPAAAEHACQLAAHELARLVAKAPHDRPRRADLAMTQNNLGALAGRTGEWTAAAKHYHQAAAELEALVRLEPLNPARRRELAIAAGNAAVALVRGEAWAAAKTEFDRAAQVLASLQADYPREDRYPESLIALHNNYAVALGDAGKTEAALKVFNSLSTEVSARPDTPLIRSYKQNWAAAKNRLTAAPGVSPSQDAG